MLCVFFKDDYNIKTLYQRRRENKNIVDELIKSIRNLLKAKEKETLLI